MQLDDDRPGSRLADGKPLFGHVAIDLALDVVEQSDPVQRFGGDRRAIALAASVEEAAANMRPAIGQHGGSAGTACLAELAIGFIAIDLPDTVIITEELLRPHAASARHVAVNERGWNAAARCQKHTDHQPQVDGLRYSLF